MSGGDGYLNLKTYRTIARMLSQAGLDHHVETMKKHYKIVVTTPMGDRSFLLGHGPNPKETTERESYRQIDRLIAEVRVWREVHADTPPAPEQTEMVLVQAEAPAEPALQVRDDTVYADSRNIAAVFGREHKTVLAAIRSLECSINFNQQNFLPVEYYDAKGERRPAFELTRDGFAFLVMGFTGANAARFKEAYIARFNEMEAALRRPALATLSEEHLAALLGPIKGIVVKRTGAAVEAGVQAIVAAITAAAERQTEEHRHLFRQFREPASAVALHAARFLEVGAVYGLADVSGPIPRRGKLSGDISRSLDAYCRRHGVIVRSAQIGGRDVSHWPREVVLEWLAAAGTQMIERHLRAFGAEAAQLRLVQS
jgi:Rha family phage regulatory protein